MEISKEMPKRGRPEFKEKLPRRLSDPIIYWLRHNYIAVAVYTWVTDTLVPLILAVVIVLPVGVVLLLFYLPKFYRNLKRRRRYRVEVIPEELARESVKRELLRRTSEGWS